jgi:hypothetical protein
MRRGGWVLFLWAWIVTASFAAYRSDRSVFDMQVYGAKADAGTIKLKINGGVITCDSSGTIACSNFTTATMAGKRIKIPNAVETKMGGDGVTGGGGTTLVGAITSSSSSLTLAPPSGTHWQTILPTSVPKLTTMMVDNELITCSNVTNDSFTSCTRASEKTTAASHANGAPVKIFGFDVVDAGSYTAVRSYSYPFHTWDVGHKIVIPSAGWTYASPGIIQSTDPAGFGGSNESDWYLRVLPRATSTGSGFVGSIFSSLTATIVSVDPIDGHVTLSGASGTLSTAIVNQVETATVGTDNSSVFQSAINAASVNGGTVYFPSGNYLLVGSLTPKSNVTVDATQATIYLLGSAEPATTDYNGGNANFPYVMQGQGTFTLDDPQMSTFSYSSGIVAPCYKDLGGSLAANTTYYYKVTGLDTTGKETALSTTTNFIQTDSTNKTIRFTVLKSPYVAAIHDYRIWRGTADSSGNVKYGLLKQIASATANTDAIYWNPGITSCLGFKDDGSLTVDFSQSPPTTNQTYTPLSDFQWNGGHIIGSRSNNAFINLLYGEDIHFDGITFDNVGDGCIRLQAIKNVSVTNCQFNGGAHGVVLESCTHAYIGHNIFNGQSIEPAMAHHPQNAGTILTAHSTVNPFSDTIVWEDNEIKNWGMDYGNHSEGIIAYGTNNAMIRHNYLHDSWGDPNNSYEAKGSIWSPTIDHGLTIAIRLRDSEGTVSNNRIFYPNGSGIQGDNLRDFSDQNINDSDNNILNDRAMLGGRSDIINNLIYGADVYAINVAAANYTVPAASAAVPTYAGSYSVCPIGPDGTVLTSMSSYADGQPWGPAIIPPFKIEGNTIRQTGSLTTGIASNGIICASSYSQIKNNLLDGFSDAAIIVQLSQPNGKVWQPTDVQIVDNHVRNIGLRSGGTANAIVNFGVNTLIQNNTIIARDTGTLSGSSAISTGAASAGGWSTVDYTAFISRNTCSGFTTETKFTAASGHTARNIGETSAAYLLVTATPFTIGANDDYLIINVAGAAAGTLPAANTVIPGRVLHLKDGSGAALTNPITLTRAGSDTIDGATSIQINENYGALSLISDGVSKWWVF